MTSKSIRQGHSAEDIRPSSVEGLSRSPQDESEQLIELISEQTSSLLRDHWADIQTYRDDDADIKVSLVHRLSYDGSQRMVKTTISFSHRVKDEVEGSLDTAQADLPLKVTIQKGRSNDGH